MFYFMLLFALHAKLHAKGAKIKKSTTKNSITFLRQRAIQKHEEDQGMIFLGLHISGGQLPLTPPPPCIWVCLLLLHIFLGIFDCLDPCSSLVILFLQAPYVLPEYYHSFTVIWGVILCCCTHVL